LPTYFLAGPKRDTKTYMILPEATLDQDKTEIVKEEIGSILEKKEA
jgi:hypothetical protein